MKFSSISQFQRNKNLCLIIMAQFCIMLYYNGDILAWWLRHRTSMPKVVGSIPAQVRAHGNTLRQGMNPWLLPDCTESGSIGAQNVQHLEIRWRFNGVLSPGGNVRLGKSCGRLPLPVQDYKPIPLPLYMYGYDSLMTYYVVHGSGWWSIEYTSMDYSDQFGTFKKIDSCLNFALKLWWLLSFLKECWR